MQKTLTLTLNKTVHSKTDNTIKYVFNRKDNSIMELSYINKNDGKDIICVPSQTMCNLGCKFCQATDYIRKIKVEDISGFEILEAVNYIYRELKLDNNPKTLLISYMGMGEPIVNYNNIIQSMLLIQKEYQEIYVRFAFATSLPKKYISNFFKMTESIKTHKLPVKLHISLHYTEDKLRKEWMPTALEIEPTIKAAEFYNAYTKNQVEVHYALIADVNDTYEDQYRLATLLKGTNFNVKFLLYNEKISLNAHASDVKKFNEFKSYLDLINISSEYYIPPGIDVGASCGQFLMGEYDRKIKETKITEESNTNISGDALDGCSSIRQWEERTGRGFWGNTSTGYIHDKNA